MSDERHMKRVVSQNKEENKHPNHKHKKQQHKERAYGRLLVLFVGATQHQNNILLHSHSFSLFMFCSGLSPSIFPLILSGLPFYTFVDMKIRIRMMKIMLDFFFYSEVHYLITHRISYYCKI